MKLVLLYEQTVAVANRTATNSLWKAGRPYLCIPMRQNGNVHHIIPFRTSARRPYAKLTNTLIFPLKRNMGKNADGEYPYLDLSKSFLVRKNHFKDLPANFHIEGYMRLDQQMGLVTRMGRQYIHKMNAGKLENIRRRNCVDYVGILNALDRALPLPVESAVSKGKRLSKAEKAFQQERKLTYDDVIVDPVHPSVFQASGITGNTAHRVPTAQAQTPGQWQEREREDIYDEIESEIKVGTAEDLAQAGPEPSFPLPVGSAASSQLRSAPATKQVDASQKPLYGTTIGDIRASEQDNAVWEQLLESSGWVTKSWEKEKEDLYADVGTEFKQDVVEPPDSELQQAMRDEIYGETEKEDKDLERGDKVDPLSK